MLKLFIKQISLCDSPYASHPVNRILIDVPYFEETHPYHSKY